MPPRPRIVDEGDAHGIGCTRHIPIAPGTVLIERIEEGAWPDRFTYRVVNPSWRTFPVKRHRGDVRFEAVGPARTRLTWDVTFVPLFGGRLPALLLTRWVIGRYLRSLSETAANP